MIPSSPPIAEPKTIPTRVGSKPLSPASATASFADATANCTFRSNLRASLAETTVVGSNPLTSAAIRTGNPSVSNAPMKSTPLRPLRAASHEEDTSFPIGVTAPRPVTTTRRIRQVYQTVEDLP